MRVKDEIKNLKPYFIDEKSVKFKLDANESPHDLPDDAKKELAGILAQVQVNRYPDPSLKTVRRLVAQKEGVPEDTIIFGNGSDEIIYMLYMCIEGNKRVSFPSPGFSMYAIGARIFGKELVPYNLREPFYELDEATFNDALQTTPDIVFISNPNNPTANSVPDGLLLEALKNNTETVFVVDEAYGEFCGRTLVPQIRNNKNLLIMKTFSKIGFASIRLGYIMGERGLIQEIEKVRLPYNINSYTQKIAEYFFKKQDVIAACVSEIISERSRLFEEMKAMGLFVLSSEANFITFKMDHVEFYRHLIENGILLKDLYPSFGMKSFYRLTIGKREENDYFLKVLKEFIDR